MWSIPLLAEEGWLRHQLKSCEATEAAADGVVSSAKSSGLNSFAELTTPSAPFRNGSIFIYGASTPPLRGGEYVISIANRSNSHLRSGHGPALSYRKI